MKIIGIVGNARSGKDTVANMIIEENINPFLKIDKDSFAKPLKDMACAFFGKDCESLELYKEDCESLYGINIRKFYQNTGALMRQMNEDIFVELIDVRLTSIKNDPHTMIIIPDVRFKNEADYIKSFEDAILLKVERPSIDKSSPIYNDKSEQEIDLIEPDFTIVNDGTLEDLRAKVLDFVFQYDIFNTQGETE